MTTPPTPPDGPGEPVNLWAAPAGPAAGPFRPPAPATAGPPSRTSRVVLTIAAVLGVLVLGTGASVMFHAFVKHGGLQVADTTTPYGKAGDCVKLTGVSAYPKYEKVSCDAGVHNYTVGKVLGSKSEKCGEDHSAYTKFSTDDIRLCLIPVFVEGQCYDFSFVAVDPELKPKECGKYAAVRAKVLANTVDKAACGESPALALAYPEIKTTYCFTDTYGR
ncbi:LppU/SCO3897 family protein [Lentzea sp. NPDC004789]